MAWLPKDFVEEWNGGLFEEPMPFILTRRPADTLSGEKGDEAGMVEGYAIDPLVSIAISLKRLADKADRHS